MCLISLEVVRLPLSLMTIDALPRGSSSLSVVCVVLMDNVCFFFVEISSCVREDDEFCLTSVFREHGKCYRDRARRVRRHFREFLVSCGKLDTTCRGRCSSQFKWFRGRSTSPAHTTLSAWNGFKLSQFTHDTRTITYIVCVRRDFAAPSGLGGWTKKKRVVAFAASNTKPLLHRSISPLTLLCFSVFFSAGVSCWWTHQTVAKMLRQLAFLRRRWSTLHMTRCVRSPSTRRISRAKNSFFSAFLIIIIMQQWDGQHACDPQSQLVQVGQFLIVVVVVVFCTATASTQWTNVLVTVAHLQVF